MSSSFRRFEILLPLKFNDGSEGGLNRFVNVYVNDDDIRYLEQLDTKVGDGDVISILPAVAGG